MKSLKNVLIILVALIIIMFSVSCDNTTYTGSEVVIEEPSFIDGSSEGKSLVNATAKIDLYKLKMIPQWTSSYGIVGDTSKILKADKDGYIVVEPPFNNLGFFSQGLWNFGLRAYTKDINTDEYVLVYEIEKTVAINSDSNIIQISASEIVPSDSTTPCTIKLGSFDFLSTGPISEYGKVNDLGMMLSYKITDLKNTDTKYKEIYIDDVTKVQSVDNNGIIGTVNDIVIKAINNEGKEVSLFSGSYSLSIYLNEYVDGNWVHTGGTSISFVIVPGIEINITGDSNLIDLCRYDYVTPGASGGIVVDSGVSSTVSVKAYNSSNTEITSTTVGQTVTLKAETKEIIDENTSNPITSSSYKWFVDGVEQEGTSINSGNLTFTPTTAKTYTITYMFLDGTNYNTISGNYYLTVTAATNN